jgi:nucleoid-associated protein EbfC
MNQKQIQKMMQQAQKMAQEAQRAQEELAEVEVEGSAGGGAVKAVVTGDQRVVRVDISPDVFDGEPDADDLEMLGDTVTAAINDALDKVRAKQAEALGPLAGGMGGLGLPGM